jgi:hypothetical protein
MIVHEPKLLPVLIPKPLWGINAHSLLSWESWQKIRQDTFSRDMRCCVICSHKGRLECHEVFAYNDTIGIAVLVRLESRCGDCHDCNHLGRLKEREPEKFKDALKRIARINRMERAEVIQIVKEAFRLHKVRTRSWQVEVAEELLNSYPELTRLQGRYPAKEQPSA